MTRKTGPGNYGLSESKNARPCFGPQGEMRSAALLTLHLEELGVAGIALNVHETGLRFNAAGHAEARVESLSDEVRRTFHDHSIVVVPGFFGTVTSETLVSLGWGDQTSAQCSSRKSLKPNNAS
jgi:aspartokinase